MDSHDSLSSFAKELKNRMESAYDAGVHIDEMSIVQSDGTQVRFQRDDLYRFIISVPEDEKWMPSKVYAYVPEEIDKIADRPDVPVVGIQNVSVKETLNTIDERAPRYQGEFEYEE